MEYQNPVIKGFYPDPSVCKAGNKYYLAASSFHYFPGVPIFESYDLVNWTQVGFALTRREQLDLDGVPSSGGIFAPTIRYNDGRFYMVTANDTLHKNFYVWTDDVTGEWSDPIFVDQNGIDPSLMFDGGKVYFLSNGEDDEGVHGIVQCEIDIATGKKLSASKCIWKGTGGRFLEAPHMYHINDWYYLTAAEGGTEYGHMITYARARDPWGEFESYAGNPVLTNRNKAPYIIQGVGHGELVQDASEEWHFVCLAFRQIHIWMNYHHLGREVFLAPVTFHDDGWFTAGNDGTCDENYSINGYFMQEDRKFWAFDTMDRKLDWQFLRNPVPENYILEPEKLTLKGTPVTLDETGSPTFICMHQHDFCFRLKATISTDGGEAGITLYHDETEHYEVAVRNSEDGWEAVFKVNIGGIKHEQNSVKLSAGTANIGVTANNFGYMFTANGIMLGGANTKYLSSEVCGGFTGTVIGLYAVGNGNTAEFTELEINYE